MPTDEQAGLLPKDFERIAALAQSVAGLHLPEAKSALVQSRLGRRLRALGLNSFSDYCDLLDRAPGPELDAFVAALTTNVTRLFREPQHFDHLRAHVLPELVGRARAGGRIRLWSAGCSTGAEAFSAAACLADALPEAPSLDVKILATDIDVSVLARARDAEFDESEMAHIPVDLRGHFERTGRGTIRASERLRSLVVFRRLNLAGPWPLKASFDAVFCRNVVIYFNAETTRTIWEGLSRLLEEGGTLYIGHSERLTGTASRAFAPAGVTTYRRLPHPKTGFSGVMRTGIEPRRLS